jgi:hypothetical protein
VKHAPRLSPPTRGAAGTADVRVDPALHGGASTPALGVLMFPLVLADSGGDDTAALPAKRQMPAAAAAAPSASNRNDPERKS